jgi:cystathionine beta-lyase/cystathionine gamma-synthase
MKIESKLAQAGFNRNEHTGAISAPIYLSSTFRHPALGKSTGFDYTRTINPTRQELESCIASLEHGARGFAFSSGMAAITAVISMFSSGDHFVVSDDLYGGTYRLFEKVFSRFGIGATYADMSDLDEVRRAITSGTKAFFIETPTNPLLKIADIAALSAIARENGIVTIVDNTFMTPYLMTPLSLGADIVVHSGTKYLAGHNDVLCGFAVAKSEETGKDLGFLQNATGGVLSPSDSWLVMRGMKTLALRMDRSISNAQRIAEWLSGRQGVRKVYYPGLPSHEGYEIQKRQSSGSGAMLSFRVESSALAERIINNVQLISFAESLGGVETLITYPCVQTHGDIPSCMRERLGVTGDLLRLSVGIEHVDDLIADLDGAIRKIKG